MIKDTGKTKFIWSNNWQLPWESFWSIWNHFLCANAYTYQHVFAVNGLFPSIKKSGGEAFDPEIGILGLNQDEKNCMIDIIDGRIDTNPFGRYLSYEPYRSISENAIQTNVLKYCPVCAAKGYHSLLHQLHGMTKCFIHKVDLIEDSTIPYRILRKNIFAYGVDPSDLWNNNNPFPDIWEFEKNIPDLLKTIPDLDHLKQYQKVDFLSPWTNIADHPETSEKMLDFILHKSEPICVTSYDHSNIIEMEYFLFYKKFLDEDMKRIYDKRSLDFSSLNKDEYQYHNAEFKLKTMFPILKEDDCVYRYVSYLEFDKPKVFLPRQLLQIEANKCFDNSFSKEEKSSVIAAMHPEDIITNVALIDIANDKKYSDAMLYIDLLEKLSGAHYEALRDYHYCGKNSTLPYSKMIKTQKRIPYVGNIDFNGLTTSFINKDNDIIRLNTSHLKGTYAISDIELIEAIISLDQIEYMKKQVNTIIDNNRKNIPEEIDVHNLDLPLYIFCVLHDGSYKILRL